jgi:hypothetical protein
MFNRGGFIVTWSGRAADPVKGAVEGAVEGVELY